MAQAVHLRILYLLLIGISAQGLSLPLPTSADGPRKASSLQRTTGTSTGRIRVEACAAKAAGDAAASHFQNSKSDLAQFSWATIKKQTSLFMKLAWPYFKWDQMPNFF